jgi:hypothetical protein
MLRATGSTADSSRRYAAGSRGSAIQRRAPADCAHYQACAAVAPDNLNAHANRTLSTALYDCTPRPALYDHQNTHPDQRDARWHAVEAEPRNYARWASPCLDALLSPCLNGYKSGDK